MPCCAGSSQKVQVIFKLGELLYYSWWQSENEANFILRDKNKKANIHFTPTIYTSKGI